MGKFTAQNLYKEINRRNAAKKAFGNGGGNAQTTLAEHDKKVHGGHYDGGRCKFRQELAAQGKLPPNSGSGSSVGSAISNVANAAKNAVAGGFKKASDGIRKQFQDAISESHSKRQQQKLESVKSEQKPIIEQPDGELKTRFGQINTTSRETMNNIVEIERYYSEAKSPEAKQKIADAYKELAMKLNGEVNPQTEEELDKWHDGKMQKLDEEAEASGMGVDEYRKRSNELMDKYKEHLSRINGSKSSEDVATQEPDDKPSSQDDGFSPKTHDEVSSWYDKKSTELEDRKSRGEISDDEYNRLQDELDTKSDTFHEQIDSQKTEAPNEDNGNAVSEVRKSFRDALQNFANSRIDSGKGSHKDESSLDYIDAHNDNDRALSEGRISKEEHAKRREAIDSDNLRRSYAKRFGVNYTPYRASVSNGRSREISEKRKKLQNSLENWQSLLGNSLIGKVVTNEIKNKISELKEPVSNGNTPSKVQNNKTEQRGENRGLRTIHGDINHGGNAEVQKLIEQMENEYANAKNSGEKMTIMGRFKKLKSMYENSGSSRNTMSKSSPKMSKSAQPSDPLAELTKRLNSMSEADARDTYQAALSKASNVNESLDDKDKHIISVLEKRFGNNSNKK